MVPRATFGDLIVENFDYGDTGGNLIDFGSAGDGWGGGWSGNNAANYFPDTNLTYTADGYSNLNNDANTGSAGGGSNPGNVSRRDFSSGLDGTVWFSALANMANTGQDLLFWLTGDATNNNFVAIRGDEAHVRVAGNTMNTTGQSFADNTTHLWLVRATMDSAGDDTLDFWINPDLSGGESGLGTPLLSQTGQMGATMTGVGISMGSGTNLLDAIRVSNEENGFELVTVIPEPGTFLLVGIAGFLLAYFRRRLR